jgi:hypothetical protein
MGGKIKQILKLLKLIQFYSHNNEFFGFDNPMQMIHCPYNRPSWLQQFLNKLNIMENKYVLFILV